MLDIDLLRSFVSVVDTGGFTRAGERVHRTQSTVSQQIRRLEDTLGYPLLHRTGKQATPTEQGERLVSYARRILALEQEALDVVARPGSEGVLRLGMPEDFAAYRLTELLSDLCVKATDRVASMMAPANASPKDRPNDPAAELMPAASLTRSSEIGPSV